METKNLLRYHIAKIKINRGNKILKMTLQNSRIKLDQAHTRPLLIIKKEME